MRVANKFIAASRPQALGMLRPQLRSFAALSEQASSINVASVTPSDVRDSSVRGVRALLQAIAQN